MGFNNKSQAAISLPQVKCMALDQSLVNRQLPQAVPHYKFYLYLLKCVGSRAVVLVAPHVYTDLMLLLWAKKIIWTTDK